MRKRLTQIMPFLIPIRSWQKKFFYFLKMKFDKNLYSKYFDDELLPYEVSSVKSVLINENSGYDIKFQINKIDNLKITSKTMNKLLILPGETFSFCNLSRKYKKYGKYKEGLVLIDNKIVPKIGGGICGLSNLLYYAFLLTPLSIIERHGHNVKSLPNAKSSDLEGIDATISSGWKDLKVKNNTANTYQILIEFDEEYMYIKILSNSKQKEKTNIINENFKYIKKNEKIYESVDVVKEIRDIKSNELKEKIKLYNEMIEVTYKLPENVKIEEIEL